MNLVNVFGMPKTVRDLEFFDFISDAIERAAESQKTPTRVAIQVVDELRSGFGGCLIYVPLGSHADAERRRQQIIAEFDGGNQVELARKHKVSVAWVYTLLRIARDPQSEPLGKDASR